MKKFLVLAAMLAASVCWGQDFEMLPLPRARIFLTDKITEANGKHIYTTEQYIHVIFDRSQYYNREQEGQQMWDFDNRLTATLLSFKGATVATKDTIITKGTSGTVELSFPLSAINIEPNNGNDTTISVTAQTIPVGTPEGWFTTRTENATVTYKKLTTYPSINNVPIIGSGQIDLRDRTMQATDTLVLDAYWRDKDESHTSVRFVVRVISNAGSQIITVGRDGKIAFTNLPSALDNDFLRIIIYSRSDVHVDAKEIEIWIRNNPDKTPPFIDWAVYRFADLDLNGNRQAPDTLHVRFSEHTEYNRNEERVFYLWRNGINYEMKVVPITPNGQEMRFIVVGTRPNDQAPNYVEPTKGDSIYITPFANVRDRFDNRIDDTNREDRTINPIKALELGPKNIHHRTFIIDKADASWYIMAESEFTITTAEELAGIALIVNSGSGDFSGKTIKLGNNIVLNNPNDSEIKHWAPIGTSEKPFKGTFDGNGFVVIGVFVVDMIDNVGLFGYTNGGKISKLGVVNSYVSGIDNIGGLVGTANGTTIEYCFSTAKVIGRNNVGGLIGSSSGATTQCYATGDISGVSAVGGLIGNVTGGTIVSSYFNSETLGGGDNGTGKTEEQMRTQSTYIGWDFRANIGLWKIDSEINGGYPYMVDYSADITSIRKKSQTSRKYGIVLEKAVVSKPTTISVVAPENVRTKVVIYDNLGNIISEGETWNLKNKSGRDVANGTYLVVVEATGVSGKTYWYNARIGVRR